MLRYQADASGDASERFSDASLLRLPVREREESLLRSKKAPLFNRRVSKKTVKSG